MANFLEAFDELQAGRKVGRGIWDKDTRLVVRKGVLLMQAYGGPGVEFILDWEDMSAIDWYTPEGATATKAA